MIVTKVASHSVKSCEHDHNQFPQYNLPHSFSCAPGVLKIKRKIAYLSKQMLHRAITIAPGTGEVQTRHE